MTCIGCCRECAAVMVVGAERVEGLAHRGQARLRGSVAARFYIQIERTKQYSFNHSVSHSWVE
jgi:hypothetical protein